MWAASNSVRSVKTRFRLPISPAAEKTNMRPALFDSTFVTLGKGRLACIKRIPSENAAFLFAKAPMAQPRHIVFVLCAADSQQILVTGTRESALANAAGQQLDAVYIH